WNALHTFVRVPIAALLAYAATSHLSSEKQLLATLVGGAIALAAHGGKTAARAAVTPSPEPFSNISLSLGEDALAIFLTWFATRHPYSAAVIVIVFLALIVAVIRGVIRALKALFRRAEHELVHLVRSCRLCCSFPSSWLGLSLFPPSPHFPLPSVPS